MTLLIKLRHELNGNQPVAQTTASHQKEGKLVEGLPIEIIFCISNVSHLKRLTNSQKY